MRTRCAVLGSPIAHSLSPALHTAAYAHLGLDWSYGRHEVGEDGLPGFLAGLDSHWRGLSLTMPLKRAALACVDDVTHPARLVGAVNTVLLEPGHRTGDNTDVPGMVAALREQGVDRVPSATVLGGGATARSALAALAQVTGSVTVLVRTPARADELLAVASQLAVACAVRPWAARQGGLDAPLVVDTTPPGATDDLVAGGPGAVLLDLGYDPWPTPMASAWQGDRVVSGLDVLVHQAALQVQLMTGRPVPVAVLRAAGIAALADRRGR